MPSQAYDLVVIGGGPAGIAAATVAAERGRSVVLVEGRQALGGPLWRDLHQGTGFVLKTTWLQRLQASRATLELNSEVVAVLPSRELVVRTATESRRIAAAQVIVATGARELFLPFPGWTLPGICGVGGLQVMVKGGLDLRGARVAVAGTGPLLWAAADSLLRAGAQVLAIVEQASTTALAKFAWHLTTTQPGKSWQALRYRLHTRKVPLWTQAWVEHAHGEQHLRRVDVRMANGKELRHLDLDFLACGFGLIANTEVAAAFGCARDSNAVIVDAALQTSVPGIWAVGENTAIGGVDKALLEGQCAAYASEKASSLPEDLRTAMAKQQAFAVAMREAFALRRELLTLADEHTVICRCEDVTLAEVRAAQRESLATSGRALRLATRCGMGRCQGRICGPITERLWQMRTNAPRLPLVPTNFASLLALCEEESAAVAE